MGNRMSGRKPVYSSDGNYQYDENGNKTDRYTISKGEREETQDTLWGWNVGAILAVFIPIFLLFIAQLIQSQNSGSRWRLWRGDDRRYVGLWIVYFWSLLLFIGMIWYGNRVALTDRASQNMRTLVGALFVFMCLCGMLCILAWAFAVKTGYQYRGVNWLGQWPAFVFLAWLCMGIFCALFVSAIWRRLNMRTKNGAFDYSRRDEDVVPDA